MSDDKDKSNLLDDDAIIKTEFCIKKVKKGSITLDYWNLGMHTRQYSGALHKHTHQAEEIIKAQQASKQQDKQKDTEK
jgi:hypothetical protein